MSKMACKNFTYLCVLCALASFIVAEPQPHDHDEEHAHDEKFDPFHETLEVFHLKEGQNVSAANLTEMIEELFIHKFGCTDGKIAPHSCDMCLTADNVFSIVSAEPENGLTEDDFLRAAVVMVTYLLDLQNRCQVGGDPAATTYEEYLDTLKSFYQVKEYHQLVETLMHRLNKTYTPHEEHDEHEEEHAEHEEGHGEHEEGHGEHEEHDHEDKCMNEERFIRNLGFHGDAQPTPDMVELTAASFILYFLKGYELKEVCVDLPSEEEFLADIFTVLGAPVDTLTEDQFLKILAKLKIGTEHTAGGGADPHAGHDHRRKRSVSLDGEAGRSRLRSRRSLRRTKRSWLDDVAQTMDRRERGAAAVKRRVQKRAITKVTVDSCLDVHQLMSIHNIDEAAGVTKAKFMEVCPALIQQQISGACNVTSPITEAPVRMTNADSFGYGTLMVLVISLMAMLGALAVPCINTDLYNSLLVVFIALAVATMSGDALLHLMPMALGLHDHTSHEDHADEETVQAFVWKQVALIGSMYLFFLVECTMAALRKRKPDADNSSGHGHSHALPLQVTKANSDKYTDKNDSLSSVKTIQNGGVHGVDNPAFSAGNGDLANVSENSNHNNVRRLSEVTELEKNEDKKRWSIRDIQSIAVMVLMGDTLHNFIDGIAIGAAFAQDINSGVSTSIAVLCHELPHELGDFAVLLSSGMPVKWALLLNFMSACAAFVGLYIGIGIAVDMATRQWIFALTAGMFLYVALVNMLPELLSQKTGGRLKTFILQNLGLITGYVIMLLIAIYEEDIIIR